jgi:hypothetical protein
VRPRSGLQDEPDRVALLAVEPVDGLGGVGERDDVADGPTDVEPAVPGEGDELFDVLGHRAVVAEDLLLEVAEDGTVPDDEGLVGEADQHEPSVAGETADRLFAHRGDAGEVERRGEPGAAGRLDDPLSQRGVGGIEGEVGAEVEGALPGGEEGVDGEDRGGADETQELDGVGPETADPPTPLRARSAARPRSR